MAKVIVMPKLGLTMKKGKIVKWYKKENEEVKKGDKLFSIETDKLTNDFVADEDGILLKIIENENSTVDCLKPVAIIGNAGDDISNLLGDAKNTAPLQEKNEEKPIKTIEADTKSEEKVKISPVAKKLAIENKIDFTKIKGSGPNGRIVLEDIQKELENKNKTRITPTAEVIAESIGVDASEINKQARIDKEDILRYNTNKAYDNLVQPVDKRTPMSTMRKIISERMTQSAFTAPTVNYTISVDMTKLKEIKEEISREYKITYTDLIVKITSVVLLDFPLLNSSIDGEEIITRNYVNMGVAVALDEGLLVPVVTNSHIKSLRQISLEINDLTYRAKTNQLTTDELDGGTFTITNIGKYGVESFTPIINQPQSAILGINAIIDKPIVKNEQINITSVMNLSLTADHRTVDGAVAAQFLQKLKTSLENPIATLVR
ncbi:MAG TPA: dihydrolipoamide acetyltransferase family protein [Soehngenia sp.]|nr:dihydrolipoamide acetyltransferase family protein [Soehngenia sp.]